MIGKHLLFILLAVGACTREPRKTTTLPFELPELKELNPQLYKVKVFDQLTAEEAKSLERQKLFLIKNLFREEKSPYPGMTSQIVRCPEKFQPQVIQSDTDEQTTLRIQLYANSRQVYGVCDDKDAKFKSVYLLVYCRRSQKAALVEAFSNKKEIEWSRWLTPGPCL